MAMSLPPSALQLAPAPGTPNTPALNILEKLAPGGFPQDSKDRLNKLFDPLEQKKRKTESGQLDLQQQQTALQSDQLAQMMSGAGIPGGSPDDPSWKLMFDQLKTAGNAKDAFNEAGQPRSNAELRAALESLPAKGTAIEDPEKIQEAQGRLRSIERIAPEISRRAAQAKKGELPVGIPSASAGGQIFFGLWDKVGITTKNFQEQKNLKRLMSERVAELAPQLQSSPSRETFNVLAKTVPAVDDSVETWSRYLEEWDTQLAKEYSQTQQMLGQQPTAGAAGASAAPAETQEPVRVTTFQEAASLPEGTPYIDPETGETVIAGQE